jgi:hypothetical protein
MASGNDRATVVSGADVGDAARRRNVPGTPQQVLVPQPQQPDDKKPKKVGAHSNSSGMPMRQPMGCDANRALQVQKLMQC